MLITANSGKRRNLKEFWLRVELTTTTYRLEELNNIKTKLDMEYHQMNRDDFREIKQEIERRIGIAVFKKLAGK